MKTNNVLYFIELLNAENKWEFLDEFHTTKKRALLSLSGWNDIYPTDSFRLVKFTRAD